MPRFCLSVAINQKMNNRSRTEIVSQILEIVNDFYIETDGVTQTKLMHWVRLSRDQLKEYLVLLSAHRLLIHDSRNRRHSITEKGLRFLEIYYKLIDMIGIEEGEEEEEVDYSELQRMSDGGDDYQCIIISFQQSCYYD
jgi:predicted transcriptional regulator